MAGNLRSRFEVQAARPVYIAGRGNWRLVYDLSVLSSDGLKGFLFLNDLAEDFVALFSGQCRDAHDSSDIRRAKRTAGQ